MILIFCIVHDYFVCIQLGRLLMKILHFGAFIPWNSCPLLCYEEHSSQYYMVSLNHKFTSFIGNLSSYIIFGVVESLGLWFNTWHKCAFSTCCIGSSIFCGVWEINSKSIFWRNLPLNAFVDMLHRQIDSKSVFSCLVIFTLKVVVLNKGKLDSS